MSTPLLVFVVGVAGSGKSTVARVLCRELHAAYLDKDSLATPLTEKILAISGEAPGARDGSALYKEQIMPLEYEALLAVAGDVLSVGTSCVLDAPFGAYFAQEDFVTKALEGLRVPARPILVRVSASSDVTRERLLSRGSDRDAWKLDHWDEFWASQRQPQWRGLKRIDYVNEGDVGGGVAQLAEQVLAE